VRDEQEKRAMGWREVEQRKLNKELEVTPVEPEKFPVIPPAIEHREVFERGSLADRVGRALCKRVCHMLDEERQRNRQFKEDVSRRDWEGQDNMA
jgi:hypothetical protein